MLSLSVYGLGGLLKRSSVSSTTTCYGSTDTLQYASTDSLACSEMSALTCQLSYESHIEYMCRMPSTWHLVQKHALLWPAVLPVSLCSSQKCVAG